jgi:erythromycin esterase-like protein
MTMTKTMRWVWLVVCCVLAFPAWATSPAQGDPDAAEIDRAVQAVCSKDVVMLGEDGHHAGAATLAVKVWIVKQLVQRCGFGGVVFEATFYEMLAFDRSLDAGTASRQQLSDAIGAVWSRYPEFKPLVGWLYGEAKAGRIRVGGMDPQAGGITDYFASRKLPALLSAVLPGKRRAECEDAIDRQNNWKYDDAHPYGAAALGALRGCMRDIEGRLDAPGAHAPLDLQAMADAYADYLAFQDGGRNDLRDRAMYRRFAWLRAQWPQSTRIIVWTASVHAAKSLDGAFDYHPFGGYVHADFGSRAAAIGFSALAGRYGNVGGYGAAHTIDPAAPGSLEERAFAAAGAGSLRFLDQAQLQAMGKVSCRAVNYAQPYTVDWSQVLDGVIVLRAERAAKAAP